MDLSDLKRGAINFAYQLSKNFPEGEKRITHYICEKEVVVISTKKLYIFYYNNYINYEGDILSKVVVSNVNIENRRCKIIIQEKEFDLLFSHQKELEFLLRYIEKYKKKR